MPHPSATHLIYSPLFPLMLLLPDGIALSVHYSIMTAIGVSGIFVLSRRLGASPLFAALGALTWFSSNYLTQTLFFDFWTQAFTVANLAPILVILLLDWFEAGRRPIRPHTVLLLGLVGGVSCTTPAGSLPFALPLIVMVAIHFGVSDRTRVGLLTLAFLMTLAIYSPVLLELWQETGKSAAARRHTMDVGYSAMAWTALMWPLGGDDRSAGWGAPFGAVALFSIIAALRPDGKATRPITWRLIAAGAATCVVMYVLPVSVFPVASGNGTWGQRLTIFAIPLAAAQVTTLYRHGGERLRFVLAAFVAIQVALVGYSGVLRWNQQRAKPADLSVGHLPAQPSELERALMQRTRPNRDRVLLSSSAEEVLFRRGRDDHFANFARLGIPLVNGVFKFVDYQSIYPSSDPTWGGIRTSGESPTPELQTRQASRFSSHMRTRYLRTCRCGAWVLVTRRGVVPGMGEH